MKNNSTVLKEFLYSHAEMKATFPGALWPEFLSHNKYTAEEYDQCCRRWQKGTDEDIHKARRKEFSP